LRTSTLCLLLIVLLALALVGCSKPAEQPPAPAPTVTETPPPPAAPAKAAAKPAAEKPSGEKPAAKAKTTGPKLEGEKGKPVVTTKSGLKYVVLSKGTGKQPTKGATIVAEYTGWLTDGTKFDSSKDHPGEFSFPVGLGQVIPGWDEALLSMKVGERRKLIVPPNLAYGANPPPGAPIPPNATLIFEVKLVKIK
jgi:peptidylprolyl isomerase